MPSIHVYRCYRCDDEVTHAEHAAVVAAFEIMDANMDLEDFEQFSEDLDLFHCYPDENEVDDNDNLVICKQCFNEHAPEGFKVV